MTSVEENDIQKNPGESFKNGEVISMKSKSEDLIYRFKINDSGDGKVTILTNMLWGNVPSEDENYWTTWGAKTYSNADEALQSLLKVFDFV